MFRNDRASKWLGMQILQVTPGRAVLAMTVRDEMLNGHDICHGGLITTLADSAFAFACNSYNELTVASGFAVDLLAPGRLGDVLTATCHEVSKAGRTGVYDCEVSNQNGAAHRGVPRPLLHRQGQAGGGRLKTRTRRHRCPSSTPNPATWSRSNAPAATSCNRCSCSG